jgi:hypothetical protein
MSKPKTEPPERIETVSVRVKTSRREIEKEFTSLRDLINWLSEMHPKHPALKILKTYGLDALEIYEGVTSLQRVAERHGK